MADTNIKGLSELNAFLQTLPAKVEKNILRGALRAGANHVRDTVKENVPVDSGVLRDGFKVSTRSKGGTVAASVKAKGKHAHIAHWIEFGTAPHTITAKNKGFLSFAGGVYKAVNHPGMRPRPFMRPALDSAASAAVVAVGEYIKKRLTKHGIDASGVEIEAESDE